LRQAAKVLHAIDAIDSSAWKENADKETLTRAKGSVRTAADGLAMAPTAEDATTRMSTVASELGAVRRLLRRVDPAALARLEEAVKGAPPPLPPSGESTAFTFEDFAPSAAPAEQTPAQRRRQFERIDRQWTLASGVLAVFSGLLALYVVTPTWGTPGDYLKALLWGSVVSEGTKAVTALVAKTSVSSS
jgi:hypothetical protein